MATPQTALKPHFEGNAGFGFDPNATPRWQMVGSKLASSSLNSVKLVTLRNGAGWTVASSDDLTASIKEDPLSTGGASRLFEITGKKRGTAVISGVHPDGRIVRLLDVEVKDAVPLKLAFQFVQDSYFNKTETLKIGGLINQLKQNMGSIFELQANRTLDITRDKEVQVNTSIADIIGKHDRNHVAFTGELRGPYYEWEKLVAEGDSRAAINIFFMPRSMFTKHKSGPSVIVGMDGNVLYEDETTPSIERMERILGFWIAYMLGCPETNNKRDRSHLMFRSLDDRDARFISKECANILNPTIPP